jgi:IclR family transcriptional regulator, acetate operon repressor
MTSSGRGPDRGHADVAGDALSGLPDAVGDMARAAAGDGAAQLAAGDGEAERVRRDPLSKALQLITWMVEQEPDSATWGIREMASAVGLPPSTIYRVLVSLERLGLVESDDSSRYRLGMSFFRLAWRATARLPIHRAALAPMRELAAASNETALLGLLDLTRLQMMYVAQVESRQALRYVVDMYEWLPLHAGAGGLGILAFLDERTWQKVIDRGLTAFTDRTITDPQRLVDQLREIRSRGHVVFRGGRIAGAVGVAAPVYGALGEVVADVVLTVPESRWDDHDQPELSRLIVTCADRITELLGGHRPPPGPRQPAHSASR